MLHVVAAILHHQQQRTNGQLATSTRSQIPHTTSGVFLQNGNKPRYVATLYSLACPGVHLAGILIRRIVREVATDNKQIILRQIWFQHIRYPLQLAEIVCRYDNRYNRRNFF